jgi:hypothetical protein
MLKFLSNLLVRILLSVVATSLGALSAKSGSDLPLASCISDWFLMLTHLASTS